MHFEQMTIKQLNEALAAAQSDYQMADYSDDERVRNRERIDAHNRMDAIRAEIQKRKYSGNGQI